MTREECINKASSYIKTTAYPNPNDFTRFQFKNNQAHAWCGAFIHYVVKHDLNCDWLEDCTNFGYVPTIYNWAVKHGYYTKDYTKAKKGDLVLFSFDTSRPEHLSHVGFVESQITNGLKTVEGNTSYGSYKDNCCARKNRNKAIINGVILLPYEEEKMFKLGDVIECLQDTKLYTTVEQKESKYTIKKGDIAYVKCLYKNTFMALANPDTKEYFASAWTKEIINFKLYEEDYKKLYEEEVAKNKTLTDENSKLQEKINKAIADLQ